MGWGGVAGGAGMGRAWGGVGRCLCTGRALFSQAVVFALAEKNIIVVICALAGACSRSTLRSRDSGVRRSGAGAVAVCRARACVVVLQGVALVKRGGGRLRAGLRGTVTNRNHFPKSATAFASAQTNPCALGGLAEYRHCCDQEPIQAGFPDTEGCRLPKEFRMTKSP